MRKCKRIQIPSASENDTDITQVPLTSTRTKGIRKLQVLRLLDEAITISGSINLTNDEGKYNAEQKSVYKSTAAQ
jgi:hypothetical protein